MYWDDVISNNLSDYFALQKEFYVFCILLQKCALVHHTLEINFSDLLYLAIIIFYTRLVVLHCTCTCSIHTYMSTCMWWLHRAGIYYFLYSHLLTIKCFGILLMNWIVTLGSWNQTLLPLLQIIVVLWLVSDGTKRELRKSTVKEKFSRRIKFFYFCWCHQICKKNFIINFLYCKCIDDSTKKVWKFNPLKIANLTVFSQCMNPMFSHEFSYTGTYLSIQIKINPLSPLSFPEYILLGPTHGKDIQWQC